jgi:hypothetical protein
LQIFFRFLDGQQPTAFSGAQVRACGYAATKDALASLKNQGKALGGLRPGALQKANKVRSANADRACEKVMPVIRTLQGSGVMTVSPPS